MAFRQTLLVEDDSQIAWGVSRAIEARGFPKPHHVTNAHDAIEWVTHNECGVCFLAYKLPDMNGVDLTIRLRQRKGDLPIYMLSSAASEAVAVGAFRAGVNDYFVKDPQVYDAVVRVVQRITEAESRVSTIPTNQSIPDDMPRDLLIPSYQNRLRVIGRQIDMNRYRMAAIFEVDGGFLVRALPEHGRKADALEFPDRDFVHWITDAYRNRGRGERRESTSSLLPSGYEDFLRAIGAALDRHKAEAITIAEFSSVIVVGGSAQVDNSTQTTVGNLQWILHKDEVLQLLDEGYRRRKKAENPHPGSVLDRIFGRQANLHAATA
jgi:DNA-binding response OmpR family regulator